MILPGRICYSAALQPDNYGFSQGIMKVGGVYMLEALRLGGCECLSGSKLAEAQKETLYGAFKHFTGEDSPVAWNDTLGRTKQEVQAMLLLMQSYLAARGQ